MRPKIRQFSKGLQQGVPHDFYFTANSVTPMKPYRSVAVLFECDVHSLTGLPGRPNISLHLLQQALGRRLGEWKHVVFLPAIDQCGIKTLKALYRLLPKMRQQRMPLPRQIHLSPSPHLRPCRPDIAEIFRRRKQRSKTDGRAPRERT